MTRDEVVELATRMGWRAHGKLRKYGHSSYQCFRRGNHYLWIGLRFIERPGPGFPVTDFVSDGSLNVLYILN